MSNYLHIQPPETSILNIEINKRAELDRRFLFVALLARYIISKKLSEISIRSIWILSSSFNINKKDKKEVHVCNGWTYCLSCQSPVAFHKAGIDITCVDCSSYEKEEEEKEVEEISNKAIDNYKWIHDVIYLLSKREQQFFWDCLENGIRAGCATK